MTLIGIQLFLALIRLIEVFGDKYEAKSKQGTFDFTKDPRNPLNK